MMFHIPGLTTSVLLIAILSLSSSLAIGADDYPSRPIKLMVGASPGGTTDTMARAIAPPLASSLGRPVLVENRPGAGGNLAADAVAKAAPDGYTLLVSFTSHTINATLYPKLPFDPVTDFTPISMIATVPSLLVGNPALPAQDLAALIALAKAKPDGDPQVAAQAPRRLRQPGGSRRPSVHLHPPAAKPMAQRADYECN
jgi:tripartite-type tricarboxylate transporter receptor subunit TctC